MENQPVEEVLALNPFTETHSIFQLEEGQYWLHVAGRVTED